MDRSFGVQTLANAARDDRGEFDRHVTSNWPVGVPLGLGVLGWGPSAWRLTHEQGKDAFAFALRGPHAVVRHAEVAVVAAVERDPLASASLRQLYVTPFERMGDRGPDLLRTLGAYLSAGRNGQAAAGALGVSRQAVSDRLRSVERILGKPISAWGADLEIALRLERTQRRTDRLESRRERPKANSRTGT